jgi:thiamine-monophosphate kinase
MSEGEIIAKYFAPLARDNSGAFGLRDDCARFTPTPGTDLVVTVDAVAEGVHFFSNDDPEDIGWKALAVNVSDLASKGAAPRIYLLSIAFPEEPEPGWLSRFSRGLDQAQSAFGIVLAGGDTDRRPGPLSITITAIGEVPYGAMVLRTAARRGDIIVVSGTLGDAALGLKLRLSPELARPWGLDDGDQDFLRGRYLRPQPRIALAPAVRDFASASMDISDGLAKDLDRMCRASGVSSHVRFADVPLSRDATLSEVIVAGGDDYEILATVSERNLSLLRDAARALGQHLTPIGMIDEMGAGVRFTASDGELMHFSALGWDHFPAT